MDVEMETTAPAAAPSEASAAQGDDAMDTEDPVGVVAPEGKTAGVTPGAELPWCVAAPSA